MLTFIAVWGLATSIPSCCLWQTGGWPRQFLVIMIGGKEAGDRVRTLRDVHISYSIERGLLMQIAWNESCKFSFSSTLGRQGPLGVALSGSICGSLCSSLWLVLCDILSGSFWTALLVLSGSLRGSLTFSCSPWLVLALICFGGPCFAFQPQSYVARNLPTLVKYQTWCKRYSACK